MDERAKQFKEAAEANLQGDALRKEIATLRRFLYRNQEYRFTKSAQNYLFMAVMTHHKNMTSTPASTGTEELKEESPLVQLLEDALKMPFSVFTSPQKDKILAVYWSILGEDKKPTGGSAPVSSTRTFTVLDLPADGNVAALMTEDGEEYEHTVSIPTSDLDSLRAAFDAGNEVRVTVQVGDGSQPLSFLHHTVVRED